MSKVARVSKSTPRKTDLHGQVYEGKTTYTRTGFCTEHGRETTAFCGVNRAESDGEERWVFFCSGQKKDDQNEGHYFAVRAPFNE